MWFTKNFGIRREKRDAFQRFGLRKRQMFTAKCYISPMFTKVPEKQVLKRFRSAVHEIYGDRLARVVLFGSRARGDAQPDSDYDIAVFLRDMPDRFVEMQRLTDVGTAILYDTGEVVNAMPYPADSYNDPRMPLMYEIRREGVEL